MGINTNQQIRASFFEKWITVANMKAILKNLDDSWELLPNRVGNLNVYSPDHESKGFIDITEEKFIKN